MAWISWDATPIIIEQSAKIIQLIQGGETNIEFLGITAEPVDLTNLCNLIVGDIELLDTDSNLNLLRSAHFAQSTLPSNTLLHLGRSFMLPRTYKHIDMLDQKSVYEIYAIPFLIRLAIEKKLKAMVGFKSSTTFFTNGSSKQSDQFPTGKVINFLKDSDLVVTPLPFTELKKIYNWSCRFVHTGHKEYIWLTLKALDCLNTLFDRDNNHDGFDSDIIYLKKGITLLELSNAMNESPYFNQLTDAEIKEDRIELQLDSVSFDMQSWFFDRREL